MSVVKFYPKDAAKDPDAVLEQAKGCYSNVLVIGWDKEGTFDPRSDTGLTGREILWLMELFKHKLMAGDYNVDES